MKPSKKIIGKLKILSELAYDNQVIISEKGNYFVRLQPPHKVDRTIELRATTITRGTFSKLFVKRPLKYEKYLSFLMVTKTGRVLLGEPHGNAYNISTKWRTLTTSNYHKFGKYVESSGKDLRDVREHMSQLIFFNSKAKWLLDMPFWSLPNGIEHRIVLNYKSLSEMKKDLGYGFLSDKSFYNLLCHTESVTFKNAIDGTSKSYQQNKSYVGDLFTIILYGKLFSLQSRKNLVIILLNLFSSEPDYKISGSLRDILDDFTNYIKKVQTTTIPLIELPSNIKSLISDLVAASANTSDSGGDENLPF